MQQWLYYRLTEVKRIKEELAELKVHRESLLSCLLPSGISYDNEKVKSTPEDQTSKIYAKVDAIDNRVYELQKSMMDAIDRVSDIIKKLPGCKERMIFYQWYIEGLKAEQIRVNMEYISVDTVYKLHRKGIKKLEEAKLDT